MTDNEKKKSIFSNPFFQIYIWGVIFLTFFDPLISFRKGEVSARNKTCYSNIRILQGAVEMYNMDSKTMMTTLDQSILIKEGYLKSQKDIKCPEYSIEATYSGEHLMDDGEIICSYHGGLITKGPYDKKEEAENQIGYKVLQYTGKFIVRFLSALIWPVALLFYLFRIIP